MLGGTVPGDMVHHKLGEHQPNKAGHRTGEKISSYSVSIHLIPPPMLQKVSSCSVSSHLVPMLTWTTGPPPAPGLDDTQIQLAEKTPSQPPGPVGAGAIK